MSMPLNLLFLQNLAPTEVLLILVVALLVFGGRLPQVARNLGKSFVHRQTTLFAEHEYSAPNRGSRYTRILLCADQLANRQRFSNLYKPPATTLFHCFK